MDPRAGPVDIGRGSVSSSIDAAHVWFEPPHSPHASGRSGLVGVGSHSEAGGVIIKVCHAEFAIS
jgi:hypothetical protein